MLEQPDIKAIEVRYLLGDLSPEESASFEARYFEDESAFEDLQAVEAELIDAYVRGELSPDARATLAQRLENSPRLRQRLAFARTLSRSISQSNAVTKPAAAEKETTESIPWWKGLFSASYARRPGMTLAFAACLALVLIGGVAVVLQSLRLRNQSQQLAVERASIQQERERLNKIAADQREKLQELAATLADAHTQNDKAQQLIREIQQKQKPLETVPQPNTAPVFATLLLAPGSRSDGDNELVLKPNESGVHLQLPLDDTRYSRYRVVVRDPNKKIIQNSVSKLVSGRTLVVTLKRSTFAPGYYSVVVSGITPSGTFESVNDYEFHVSAPH